MATGICGINCAISVGGSNAADGYRFDFTRAIDEQDVTGFGDGLYGSYIGCKKNGTITLSSHTPISVEEGTAYNIVGYVGASRVITANNALCISVGDSAEATTIYDFTATFRMTGDVSVT